ncbi:unnamed protein product [Caenorhabditis angaria]|uniref:Uncharacterized protein n=1 Tax=Caenorhabditis angaria TaxID=860376 RepID=A0A9P1INH6_9PELO|nr:unnamed protein product [Caenorhabditis angaria]
MADVPGGWNDDGPSLIQIESPISQPTTRTSPPPLPSRPLVTVASKISPLDHEDIPIASRVDLIEFESEEERAATGEGFPHLQQQQNGRISPAKQELSDEKRMEEVMKEFLTTETSLAYQDYLRMFYMIRMEQERFRMDTEFSSTCAVSPIHFTRNRYRDILPYDYNRVEIKKDDENPDGYMNASFVQLPGGETRFIAAQAPLPSTLDEWWKMIDEHQVSLIVILCKLVEQDKIKCERYWPERVNEKELFGDYEIILEDEIFFNDDEYLLRKLLMQNLTTGQTRTVHQLHYREWPDHGCPSGDKQLLQMIEEMAKLHEINPTSPILVHCSAGVGRTGTIIAVNHVREQIRRNALMKIDVFELVMSLRRQRASMVQTQDQFKFVHQCIASYCMQKLGIEEEELPPPIPQRPDMMTATSSTSVKLFPPPTPTDAALVEIVGGGNYQTVSTNDPRTTGDEEEEATHVPDFPDEPPAPLGPEDLGTTTNCVIDLPEISSQTSIQSSGGSTFRANFDNLLTRASTVLRDQKQKTTRFFENLSSSMTTTTTKK